MNMEVQKNVLLQEAENWEFRELFVAYSNIEGTNWRGVLTQKKDIVLASLVKWAIYKLLRLLLY